MSVSTVHPLYSASVNRWRTVRDAVEGQEAIKRGNTRYLPATFAKLDEERYQQYIERAYWMGVTGRTKDALVGMVFRKPPTKELPPQIEALVEDIDGAGQSLDQLAKEIVSDELVVGRYGLLVDYPQADSNLDAESERRLGLRPTIAAYPAESIINWRFEGMNGKKTLTLVVLKECVEKADGDEFSHDYDIVYRVLRLRDGIYTQQVYDDAGTIATDEYAPRMAGGAPFDHIPFHIIGSTNNFPEPDVAPLYDMACLNIGHYQVTADHRENLFIHGQLTIGISTELDYATFKEANPNGIVVGARAGHYLGKGGSFSSVTAPESSSLRVALQDFEVQMVALGARLVQRGGQAETAEAARINASAEASTLDNLVNNVSEGIEAALEDMALFIGADPAAVQYKLNTEFWSSALTPQDLQAIQAGVGTLYGALDAVHMLRSGRIGLREDRTDEQILQDAADTFVPDLSTSQV